MVDVTPEMIAEAMVMDVNLTGQYTPVVVKLRKDLTELEVIPLNDPLPDGMTPYSLSKMLKYQLQAIKEDMNSCEGYGFHYEEGELKGLVCGPHTRREYADVVSECHQAESNGWLYMVLAQYPSVVVVVQWKGWMWNADFGIDWMA